MAWPAVHSAVSFLFGAWSSSGACKCECTFHDASRGDERLVALLQRQLDRCGPANLTGAAPAPVACGPPVVWLGVTAAVCFLVGATFGAVACLAVIAWQRAARQSPRELAAAPSASSTELAVPLSAATPGSRRRSAVPSELLG